MYIYLIINESCLSVCVRLCSCLFAGLTAARINLIFDMHTLIWSDCAIGYIILTFEVIKGHIRSKNLGVEHWKGRRGNPGALERPKGKREKFENPGAVAFL